MPQYQWRCLKCGKVVQVIRRVADIEVLPDEEERECDCEDTEFQRVLCASVNRWRFMDT